MRLQMSEHQDLDQRARVIIEGLAYCSIEPPQIDPPHYRPTPQQGLWVDSGEGVQSGDHPLLPDGCFIQWFFVRDWNRFIHICGKTAQLEWIEPTPVPARGNTRALFPGEEFPDLGEDQPDE